MECPDCKKLNGGLCARHIAELVPEKEEDRECQIEVADSELGNIGKLMPRFRAEADKSFG